jgi:hypothetical protein
MPLPPASNSGMPRAPCDFSRRPSQYSWHGRHPSHPQHMPSATISSSIQRMRYPPSPLLAWRTWSPNPCAVHGCFSPLTSPINVVPQQRRLGHIFVEEPTPQCKPAPYVVSSPQSPPSCNPVTFKQLPVSDPISGMGLFLLTFNCLHHGHPCAVASSALANGAPFIVRAMTSRRLS